MLAPFRVASPDVDGKLRAQLVRSVWTARGWRHPIIARLARRSDGRIAALGLTHPHLCYRHLQEELDDLKHFIALRANLLQITPPRPMSVENPEQDLDVLFSDMIGEPDPKQTRRNLRRYRRHRTFSV